MPPTIHYPLGSQTPPLGTALEVAPGVRWLRMPLPFALDHINLWLLRDTLDGRDGWSIVDCGIARDDVRAAWEAIFAHMLDGLPVLRVIVTHMHPDHIGLAHWLCERWSTAQHECRLWVSATDWNAARQASRSESAFGGHEAAAFFASHGMQDADALAKVHSRSNYYGSLVPEVPSRFRRLMGGQTLAIGARAWHCIAGYGHAPEHMSLHCPELGVLISGDMVLPKISTNVSVMAFEPEADPLTLYLDSIDALRALPRETLVLPSHGLPFGGPACAGLGGLHARIDALHVHHDERFAEVLQACAKAPRHALDLVPLLFKRPLDLHQTTFAIGESIAHLNALWLRGRLQRRRHADGVLRFEAAPSPAP